MQLLYHEVFVDDRSLLAAAAKGQGEHERHDRNTERQFIQQNLERLNT